MPQQTPELLIYNNTKLSFHEEPLEEYLEFHKLEDRFLSYSSENDRGYIGIWEIIENKLYLTDLKGFNKDMKLIGMNSLFLDEGNIFANWYSGEINILLENGKVDGFKQFIKRRLIFQDGFLIDYLDMER